MNVNLTSIRLVACWQQHYKMTQYLHIAATKSQASSWSYYRQYDSIIVIKRHLENCLNFWVSKTGMPPPNQFLVVPPFSSRTWMLCERQQPRHCCMQRRMGAWSRRLPRSISWVCQYINPSHMQCFSVFFSGLGWLGTQGKLASASRRWSEKVGNSEPRETRERWSWRCCSVLTGEVARISVMGQHKAWL